MTGDGIRIRESLGMNPPLITSNPPEMGTEEDGFAYQATGEGDGPFWWGLKVFPTGARIDPATGVMTWSPPGPGQYAFTVVLDNDSGQDEQSFVFEVESVDTGNPDTGHSDTGSLDTGTKDSGDVENEEPKIERSSCACGTGNSAWFVMFLPVVFWSTRRKNL